MLKDNEWHSHDGTSDPDVPGHALVEVCFRDGDKAFGIVYDWDQNWQWADTEEGLKADGAIIAWRRHDAPAPKSHSDAARYAVLRDWFLEGRARSEVAPHGHITITTATMVDDWCDSQLAVRPQTNMDVPKGWRLVPDEPTQAMIDAAVEGSVPVSYAEAGHSYHNMINAAPQPQQTREEHTVSPKLKPLTWEDRFETSYAESIFGLYSVWEISGSSYLRGPNEYGGRKVGLTIEDAKEAAVRDIEKRIMEALV